MLTALTLFVLAGTALVLILLAIVVAAMRQEPRGELGTAAPSLIAAVVRRVLGVYVRRPDTPVEGTGHQEECWRTHGLPQHGPT